MSAFLTFLLVVAAGLLSTGTGQPLLVQMASLNVVAVLAFTLRRRVASAGRNAASGITRRAEKLQPAGESRLRRADRIDD